MSGCDSPEDTWEEFFGSSPDLMPSIMGAIDALLDSNPTKPESKHPKRTHQAGNFAHLSPNVQKILSHVPEQELTKTFISEEVLTNRRNKTQYASMRSLKSPPKDGVEIISKNIQKLLSNLPDSELVIADLGSGEKRVGRNSSFLHARCARGEDGSDGCGGVRGRVGVTCDGDKSSGVDLNGDCGGDSPELLSGDQFSCKPLGNYLHTSPSGIASRTPAGRQGVGKFLQVTSESSMGTNSTTSSEVSRPVSMTSLGSCSSSSSGGPHQVGSAYTASAESLDSDPEPSGSQGSADSGIADQQTMSPEMRVMQEVMDTETDYVADLKEVIEGYLEPWRAEPDCPLQNYLGHLFNNLEAVYSFNRSFLEQLRVASYDPSEIANVFLRNDSGFAVYTDYCTNYPLTMDVLVELTRNERMIPLFREKQALLRHALPLGSYLLKPVQRILKYHLLLQRLSKQCEPHHKSTVDLALATMTGIASHINSMKRKHEHAVRVQEIQSQLYGWTGDDLTALGELIAEGTFKVGGARGRRHVFLFDKLLLMAKPKQDGSLAYKNHIMCSNLMLVEQVRGEPLSFHILPFDNPRLQCTLRARSPQHKREWTLQIKRVILENYSAVIPNHARQLVMQLGQDIQDTEDNGQWTPMKQHSTPQYLERRSRVRKTRDFGNRRATSQDRTFSTLGNWRRKSEPMMVPQYNDKIVPKKITKMKKAKDRSSSKFYTDISDSENCDVIGESTETLDIKEEEAPQTNDECTLEKVVSDLLMQNKEFQKFSNRKKKQQRGSEPLPNAWPKPEIELPAKADSLPRNIQLNDQIESNGESESCATFGVRSNGNGSIDEEQETISSELTDGDHPEHKIYRKSTIRFSLLQRFRAIISEEQKQNGKLPTYKQGSKSMGEKIANPDYADPYKLFANSRCSSQSTLIDHEQTADLDLMGEPERLDLSINTKEVFREFENRLKLNGSSSQANGSEERVTNNIRSSQNSDSYYETIMENTFNEQETTNVVVKKSTSDSVLSHKENQNNDNNVIKSVKRPTNPPPPIPYKPKELSCMTTKSTKMVQKTMQVREPRPRVFGSHNSVNDFRSSDTFEAMTCSKSWVKTMVGRFE